MMKWRDIAAIARRLLPYSPGRYLKRLEAGHQAGVDLYSDGKYVESERRFTHNVELARSFGEESSELIDYLKKLGDFYHSTGNYSSAEQPLLEAMTITQEHFGMEDYQVALVLNDIALLYYAQGRYQEAETSFKRLRKIFEEHAAASAEMAICLENYAAVLRRLDRDEESTQLRARAKKIRDADQSSSIGAPSLP